MERTDACVSSLCPRSDPGPNQGLSRAAEYCHEFQVLKLSTKNQLNLEAIENDFDVCMFAKTSILNRNWALYFHWLKAEPIACKVIIDYNHQ